MNVVTVKINGVEYNLKGNEQEEYLHKVAVYVDKKVRSITENNIKLSTASAAILSALNIVDDMFKQKDKYDQLKAKFDDIDKKNKDYEEDIQSFKKQLKHLEEYNGELQSKLKNNTNAQYIEEKEEYINKIMQEMEVLQETAKRYMKENKEIIAQNKQIKFELQSSKYKVLDLNHKLMENQIDLAKEKKKNNVLLRDK
ncbi:cell division protein ZapA [Clostridium fermenticellae]|uniref:Cell division protein ZapA n=1 Tax=Clostridium fermenticellae TaxID=2068654 RepID=A0A386H260_9CLOT|nr:cell division protein ZapA [Clostridium fermenticellae]AYD39782.1 cell division protein ZapA [Clostridium fermenticellae]